ncbi:putative HC-toxin efflux carrier TOXA [Cercospora beticola]|uniref:Putative HC-toxin efflux carrier TOXA n=1 Tax=Cercospora beticola TaxID=122368 RepID=A0A2G5ICL6_CERBT|nr:putative HC-toxin efflux carrier TOXA [Cercospora beticola]PIB02616.1 putative HC-toxin efflux carrier TOXA [Cercospora beticola]WPA95594.1 hypothetical protein RHO25_000196 [Cercospora beticola]
MASTEQLRPNQSPTENHDNASTTPIAPRKLFTTSFTLILIALNISIFCVALMNVIIPVSVPKITDEFHSLDSIGWYAAAYLIPTCAFQPHYGKLYARYSAKWTILGALMCFEAGILVSAFCRSSNVFIFGRALAGMGAAGVYSGALYIIAVLTPAEKTPAVQSSVGVVIGIASIVAPMLGGWLVDQFNWRWCFFTIIPGPLIAGVMLLIWLKLPAVPRRRKTGFELIKMFDPLGTMFFLVGIFCLLLALQWAGLSYAWFDPRIIMLSIMFAFFFVAFMGIQLLTGDNATIPVRILGQRTIAALSFFILCLFGQFACDMYFLPVYFQGVKLMSATEAGINMIAFIAAMVCALIAAGVLSSKLGQYVPFFYTSVFFMAIGNGMLTTLRPETPAIWYIAHQISTGAGTGLALQLPATAVQAVLPEEDFAVGLATVLFFEFLGGAVFVAAGNNIFVNKLHRRTGVNLNDDGATTVVNSSHDKVRQNLYMDALRWPFRLSLILSCLAIIGVVFLERKRVKGRGQHRRTKDDERNQQGAANGIELKETSPGSSARGSDDSSCFGCSDRPTCILHQPSAENAYIPERDTRETTRVKDFHLPRVIE